MKREYSQDHPELMDLSQPVTAELERDLLNLVSLNRYFGSHWLIRRFLKAWLAPRQRYRVLDLATGAGDIPRLMLEWAHPRGITLDIDAVDANASTLEIARKHCPYKNIDWICADALTFDPGYTYDFVCCSLALHHFSDQDAVRLLRRCCDLSHRFTVVADLERSRLTQLGVWLLTALIYRDPMTKYDGRLSVRRAFSYNELGELATAAGWTDFEQARFPFCRQAVWMASLEAGDIPVPALVEEVPLPCPT
jgi:2-polyprenyl-3-methyl-5-hydroxy-6-metoxy-1,4-benzoquinol methylase